MSRTVLRTIAISGVAVVTFAAPVAAFAAGHGHTHTAKPSHSNKHHGKPAHRHFTATGVVTAVDATAGTVTLADKGGSKDLHGTSVTVVTSSTTKVTRNDAPATLADLQVGDHVAANGLRGADGSLNAKHVNASSTPDATDSVSPAPSDTASPTPSDTASPTPSDTASPTPTDTATASTTG